jgi:cyclophilin family peptidyl-prolyl cis-trans isomerase
VIGGAIAIIHHHRHHDSHVGGSKNSKGSHSGVSAEQVKLDGVAEKAGCSDKAPYLSDVKVSIDPTYNLQEKYLYAAYVRTTSGDFIMALNSSSANIVVRDFIYLAQSGYFQCVGAVPSSASGLIGVNGAPITALSGAPAGSSISAPQYSVVMVPGSSSSPLAGEWLIVEAASGASLPNTDVIFGRVLSGGGALKILLGHASDSNKTPVIRDRILSVVIQSSQA